MSRFVDADGHAVAPCEYSYWASPGTNARFCCEALLVSPEGRPWGRGLQMIHREIAFEVD